MKIINGPITDFSPHKSGLQQMLSMKGPMGNIDSLRLVPKDDGIVKTLESFYGYLVFIISS
jgi:hypothetical protein